MTNDEITENMNIREVIEKYPEVATVFLKYNIGCIGCIASSFEKLSDIASAHKIDIKIFVKELNEAIQNKKN
ncbi:MAG: DUF1858 domain-containing protein [Thermoplasmatales archaeon]|nr:MAG: DUF1858 domain-containing protein [Thermoplasmatales archaeon]